MKTPGYSRSGRLLEASLSLVRAIAHVNLNIIPQAFDNVPTRKGLSEGRALIIIKTLASANDILSDDVPALSHHPPSISCQNAPSFKLHAANFSDAKLSIG
ncbi:hypothetical protein ARMGADRAFT_1171571 [Armillaria gallica]|uniref:Uncharacterized protein n=1 Tax=Armillaria gallica TaxID=47427 RepID=A0A2H3CD65_ARMGA|nr:hypothetical protein ARMGADRAFT_1171571 [Armillaria gallica]